MSDNPMIMPGTELDMYGELDGIVNLQNEWERIYYIENL